MPQPTKLKIPATAMTHRATEQMEIRSNRDGTIGITWLLDTGETVQVAISQKNASNIARGLTILLNRGRPRKLN
jgi:hypothetical protein